MWTRTIQGVAPVVLRLTPPLKGMSTAAFLEFARLNFHIRVELNADGDLELMPPVGGTSSIRNCTLTAKLGLSRASKELGPLFASSTLFELPNGAVRSPDAAWVAHDRWSSLTKNERDGVVPLAPDFVVELRSPSDLINTLQAKMQEYRDAGVRLGWLIDPESKTVWVYQPGAPPSQHDQPRTISGEPVLPGFVLELGPIWDQ